MSTCQRSNLPTDMPSCFLTGSSGVKQDGSVSHFFHRTFKAYTTGTKKRRKINTDELGEVRWNKTGRTKPVVIGGTHLGCKKIMVMYASKGWEARKD